MKYIGLIFAIPAAAISAACISCSDRADEKQPVIIETDMGNDIDDALSLALAYKASGNGDIDILMISNHKESKTAPEFIDILNTWYGYPDIPVSCCATPVSNSEYRDYTGSPVEKTAENGRPAYNRSGNYQSGYPESVSMYRKILSESKNRSVVIVSLGFGTTLAQLLDSKPDEYSRLDGQELVAKKVKYLSLMAGSYGKQDTITVNGTRETLFDKTKKRCEFNVANDIPAMKKVLDKWPTKIDQNPFEIGKMVMYPGSVAEQKTGPVFDAYKAYNKMPYDRPSWDILAMAYVLDPSMFGHSVPGTITLDENGFNHFFPAGDSRARKVTKHNAHYVLTLTEQQAETLKKYIVDEID